MLHATAHVAETLRNARALLKPGGFLLLVEITGTAIMRTTFCVGGLPGWWLGAGEGRRLHPGMTTEAWHGALQAAGFSGVDLVFHDLPDPRRHCMSLMASQAVDETVQQLREPLEHIGDVPAVQSLLVVGGRTLAVAKTVAALQRLAGPAWGGRITVAGDLESIDFARLGGRADVICLQELDGALFAAEGPGIAPPRLKALQTLVVAARNVLWLTTGRRADNPPANMMVGLARAISKELPHVNLQFLDLESVASPSASARTILETFIRLKILSAQGPGAEGGEGEALLWPQEPELVVEGADTLIPRVRPDQQLNDRYNARFRTMTKTATSSPAVPIGLTRRRDQLALIEAAPESYSDHTERARIEVRYSLSIPGGNEEAIYLVAGRLTASGKPVLAVSEKNRSTVSVPRDDIIFVDEKDCNGAVLERIADQIAVAGLLSSTSEGASALLLNPTAGLAACFMAESRRRGLEPLCATSGTTAPEGWLRIHPQSSVRAIQRLLPQNVAVCLDGSGTSDSKPAHLLSALSPGCQAYSWDSHLLRRGLSASPSTQASLRAAYAGLLDNREALHSELDILNVDEISHAKASILARPHLVRWETTRPLSLLVQPPDTSTLFDGAKTYLMIGMAGGLGLSVCAWAVQHGAKQLVITSRKPHIHPEWLAQARKQGAQVHVRPMDASDRASLASLVSDVRAALPPLGGVCNAAMVLTDKLFVDLDAASVAATFRPKVAVSQHLHELLADAPLDFFVMFSSALSITGGQGSGNYHAANLFMAALAAQRRRRGLAASVIHIGYVTDVGYFMRKDQGSRDFIGRMGFAPLSETDIHHAFAEAVLAGKPGNNNTTDSRSCEVGVGMEPLEEGREPAWFADPRFSHYLPTADVHEKKDGPQYGRDDIKKQVQDAETGDEVVAVVQEALCAKIETMLQLPAGSVDTDSLLTQLGIDSLVAVEIRAWFLKNIGIDVPVVKILGRSSVAQICADAAKEIMGSRVGGSPKTVHSSEPETSTDSRDFSDTASALASSPSGKESPPSPESELAISQYEDVDITAKKNAEEKSVELDSKAATAEPTADLSKDIIHTERMSAAQSRIYILGSLMNDPTAYSLMIRYDIEDNLDIDRLRNALTTTMQHHECLRTCFFARPDDNQPTQGLLSFPVRRFRHVPHATDQDIAEALEAARAKVWDIEHGETLSLTVLSRDARRHVWVLAYHHIILDASGMRRFTRDLDAAYRLQPLKRDYGTCLDFARQEQERLRSGALEGRLRYWRQEFTPLPEVLPLLPMAKASARPETPRVATVHAARVVGEDTVAAVKRACQTLGVTPFQFYLAVGQVLLTQSLGTDDLCVGVADANRPDAAYLDTVGFFLNLVPVRFRVPAGATFAEVARRTAQQMGHALEKAVPFDMLLDELSTARSSSHTPLFQVLVNYRLAMTKSVPFGGGALTITDGEEGRNPYDVTLSFLESPSEGLGVTVDCAESLYDAEGTEKLLDMYMGLLQEIVADLHVKVDECQLYSPSAVSAALTLGQGERLEVQGPPTVAERFQAVHRAYPERVAARDRDAEWTYRQLAARVHSVAAAIQAAGRGAASCVAVLCEPSNDFVASLLAILHIGAVYVPLDVGLPSSRHGEIIASCHPGLIICHESTRDAAKQLVREGSGSPAILELEEIDPAQAHEPVPCAAQPDSPAFILYTSGTTGKPKGVVLAQGGVSSWLEHTIRDYRFDAAPARILQQSALSFDMSLIQILGALCSGGTLITAPQEARRDPVRLAQLMQQHRVSWTFAVPSEYMQWLQYGRESLRRCGGWRTAMVGGEVFPDQLKRELGRLALPDLRVRNNYGPTEITFTATGQPWPLDAADRTEPGAPIGTPHPNYSICVLDAKGRPLPVGFRGEICIGGPGVALGYWDMPAETDRKFIPDPTRAAGDKTTASGRWYRTGDQGWLAPDGTVIFVGRLGGDTQVKLRGLRIELAEVEGALLKSGESLLSAAVVTVRGGDLVAHVILDPGKKGEEMDQGAVKRKLLTGLQLPQYMHPARVVVVEDLPRASTGKIDRQAVLKLPLSAGGGGSAGEPDSELSLREVELKLLWGRVLPDPYQVLTADSDFFLEGGNSLRLTKLQNEIKETLGVSVSIRQLYSAPTLRQMAARIGSEYATDEDIDWNEETAIPDSLLAAAATLPRRPRTPADKDLQVLLTGAAGVLGNAVLRALLQNPAVAKVHCIAVAPDDEAQLPLPHEKIASYPGSLSSPTLGLSPAECAALRARLDVVIHAGAAGHCLNSYSSVRRANVGSTRFLAEALCLPRAVPLLYVSSQRVPAMAGLKVLPPVPVLAEPAKTGDTGYMASRWVSERFLHRLTETLAGEPDRGFAVEVHRPCLFFGDRAPPSDALNGVLRYTRLMRTIPRFARVEGYVDVKDVDEIAADVAASAVGLARTTPAADGRATIRYRHHSSGRKVTLEEWPAYMEERYGEPFEVRDLPDWIARARAHGIHPLIATYLEGVVEKEELGLFPFLGEEAS